MFVESVEFENCSSAARGVVLVSSRPLFASSLRSRTRRRLFWRRGMGRLVARPWNARGGSGRRDGLEKMAKYVWDPNYRGVVANRGAISKERRKERDNIWWTRDRCSSQSRSSFVTKSMRWAKSCRKASRTRDDIIFSSMYEK